MITALQGFIAGAIVAPAAFWLWARRPRGGRDYTPVPPTPVPTHVPPPMAKPPRPTLNPVLVLRGDDLVTLAERDARELSDELRPYLRDVARQHGANEVTIWRHTGGEGNPLDIVAWSGDEQPPPASTWGTPPERSLIAWSATEQMVGFERRDGEPRIAICPVAFA